MTEKLSHLNERGEAHMVDVGDKAETSRRAIAEGTINMAPATFRLIADATAPKGDVVATARIAGIMAAKRTPELIPLAHPVPLTSVSVRGERGDREVRFVAECATTGPTGVEMEALTAASVAALTLYDMLKGAAKGIVIEAVRLLHKEGGRSGPWTRTHDR